MAILTREQMKLQKFVETVYIEKLGGEIGIRKWNGVQRAKMLALSQEIRKAVEETPEEDRERESYIRGAMFQSKVIAATQCDENGAFLYDPDSEEDLKEIQNFNADLLDELFEACARPNGLLPESVKTEIKNSEAIQN